MSKFNNFNPATATLVTRLNDYALYDHVTQTGPKFILVKNGKVLIYIEKSELKADEGYSEFMDKWIASFEYNARRELFILRAKVQKAEAHVADILAVFEE